MAAWHEREHQRAAAPVLSKGHRPQRAQRRGPCSRGDRPQQQAAKDPGLENTGRGSGPVPPNNSHRPCCDDHLNPPSSLLSQLSPALQTGLSQRVLPQLFGDVFLRRVDFRIELPFDVLVQIVPIAYRTIRVEEDNIRPSGVVYSPDLRDEAEGARGGGFKQLYETPGWATYDALLRLA